MPIIILADFLQTNFTKHFTPMNMGPVTEPSYTAEIKKNYTQKVGTANSVIFFCELKK